MGKATKYTVLLYNNNIRAYSYTNIGSTRMAEELVIRTLNGQEMLVLSQDVYNLLEKRTGVGAMHQFSYNEMKAVIEAYSNGYKIRWRFQWQGGGWNSVLADTRAEAAELAGSISDKLKVNISTLKPVTQAEYDRTTRMTNMD